MRRVVLVVALVAVGLGVAGRWSAGALPPPFEAEGGRPTGRWREVHAAIHVHTLRSDGTGTASDIAVAAAAAGLDVVVLTDHGDGMTTREAPRRLHGVLVIDGVEVSSWGGHYLQIGGQVAAYPLGGEPEAVVEDVARLGGLGVAAHPLSPKADLRWRAWDTAFEGIEWLNADSQWRSNPREVGLALLRYPWAPVAAVTHLLRRPDADLAAWDRRAARRRTLGVLGHDAHARVGVGGLGEPYSGTIALRAPSYAAMFRTFHNVVRLPSGPWGADPSRDAAAFVDALSGGRAYGVIAGVGRGWVRRFDAVSGGLTASIGEHLVPSGTVEFVADVDGPDTAHASLVCDGTRVASTPGRALTWRTETSPGACRLEVTSMGGPDGLPWIVTNPIYARAVLDRSLPRTLEASSFVVPVTASGLAASWRVEASPGSHVDVSASPDQRSRVVARWQLGTSPSAFAAISLPLAAPLTSFDRLVLRASTDRETRVWVQLRTPDGQRWGRSVVLDPTPRTSTLPLASLLPLDGQGGPLPLGEIASLLLVVDSTYARPGDAGTITFDEWWTGR